MESVCALESATRILKAQPANVAQNSILTQFTRKKDEEVREQVRRLTQERYYSLTVPCSSRKKRLFLDDVMGNRRNESRTAELTKHS